ncbi:MAG: DUF3450 family protein [Opitutales bacterium]
MKHSRICTVMSLSLALLIGGVSSVASADADSVQALESSYDCLIELRKTQSDEKTAWASEKEVLQDRIGLLETESDRLKKRIDDAENKRKTMRAEIDALLSNKDAADASMNAITAILPKYESRAKMLVKRLPPPLVQELTPFLSRLSADGESTTLGVTQRLQTLLGILSCIDKFNQDVTVAKEIRDVGDGVERELCTLYLGLGMAYFVDKGGTCAGMGRPGPDGWVWTRDDSLAPEMVQMLSMYDNAAEARFVDVKVEVR